MFLMLLLLFSSPVLAMLGAAGRPWAENGFTFITGIWLLLMMIGGIGTLLCPPSRPRRLGRSGMRWSTWSVCVGNVLVSVWAGWLWLAYGWTLAMVAVLFVANYSREEARA